MCMHELLWHDENIKRNIHMCASVCVCVILHSIAMRFVRIFLLYRNTHFSTVPISHTNTHTHTSSFSINSIFVCRRSHKNVVVVFFSPLSFPSILFLEIEHPPLCIQHIEMYFLYINFNT